MKVILTLKQKEALLKSIKQDCHTNSIGLEKEVDNQAQKYTDKVDPSTVSFIKESTKKEFIDNDIKQQITLAYEINKFCNEKAFINNTIDLSESQIKKICNYLDKDMKAMKKGKEHVINILRQYFEPIVNQLLSAQIADENISTEEKQQIKEETIQAVIDKGLSSPEQKKNIEKFDKFLKRDLELKQAFEKALKSSSKSR